MPHKILNHGKHSRTTQVNMQMLHFIILLKISSNLTSCRSYFSAQNYNTEFDDFVIISRFGKILTLKEGNSNLVGTNFLLKEYIGLTS